MAGMIFQTLLVPSGVNKPLYSTRYPRQKRACESNRRNRYAVDSQTRFWCGYQALYSSLFTPGGTRCKFNDSRPEALREHLAISERVKVFTCSCCPPNLMRLVGSIAEYLYTVDEETIYTQCYMDADTELTFNGRQIKLEQRTDYPYGDIVQLTIIGEGHFKLAVRIPAWCDHGSVTVNKNPVLTSVTDGYVTIDREWSCGDVVEITLPMETKLISANPHVLEACGRVAVVRGPLVYCAEGIDHGDRRWLLFTAVIPRGVFCE